MIFSILFSLFANRSFGAKQNKNSFVKTLLLELRLFLALLN
jgi:hypothetical protein